MYEATVEIINPDRVMRYVLTRKGVSLSFADILLLWQTDAGFRNFYTRLLAASPFDAFRWETPPVKESTIHQPFEFVLLNTPAFSTRKNDAKTYASYFTSDDSDGRVVTFTNLGGDARLVVPSPRADIGAYGHLAAFVRLAPESQQDALWRVISAAVRSALGVAPLWLSTAGGGVAWLHVRLDSRPKYYGYSPYKTA